MSYVDPTGKFHESTTTQEQFDAYTKENSDPFYSKKNEIVKGTDKTRDQLFSESFEYLMNNQDKINQNSVNAIVRAGKDLGYFNDDQVNEVLNSFNQNVNTNTQNTNTNTQSPVDNNPPISATPSKRKPRWWIRGEKNNHDSPLYKDNDGVANQGASQAFQSFYF